MFNVLFEIGEGRVDLDFVLPVVVSPLLLELELRAISRHERVDEVNLDLIDIDHIRNISTRRVEGQVAVNGTVVGRANLERALDHLCGSSSQSQRHWFFNNFQISLREQLTVDVLDSFLRPVNQNNLQENIVVVNLSDGFRIDWIRIACQLINFLFVLALKLAHEVI